MPQNTLSINAPSMVSNVIFLTASSVIVFSHKTSRSAPTFTGSGLLESSSYNFSSILGSRNWQIDNFVEFKNTWEAASNSNTNIFQE